MPVQGLYLQLRDSQRHCTLWTILAKATCQPSGYGKYLQFLAPLLVCASVCNFCVCSTLIDELCVTFDSGIPCNANSLKLGAAAF